MDNMELWNRVSKSDPAHVKPVKLGKREFSAIDAYYQIRKATEEFGPIGKGWSIKILSIQNLDGLVVAHVQLGWSNDHSSHEFYCYDSVGCAALHTGKEDYKRIDNEAAKKAVTDAVTKGLSWLGFNADVHEGRFDDSKYVQNREHEVMLEMCDSLLETLMKQNTLTSLRTWRSLNSASVNLLPRDLKKKVAETYAEREAKFTEPSTTEPAGEGS